MKDAKYFIFLNAGKISRLMNEHYNDLRQKIPRLSIERHMVMFQSSRSKQKITCSTNIFTPLYHLSPQQKTMPLWVDESVWNQFLENDCEFDKRELNESINERPNDSEKKLFCAIERTSTNTEKTKTDGELNYETVTTKAVTTKPQMEHEKKANEFDQRQESFNSLTAKSVLAGEKLIATYSNATQEQYIIFYVKQKTSHAKIY